MAQVHQQTAPSLSIDLWAKVFQHMKEMLEDEYSPEKNSQAQMHQLNLVCKQFKQTVASHSELVQRLFLCPLFSDSLLLSLLAWLRKNQGSVRTLKSRCKGPLVEVILAQLQSSQLTVEWVDVSGASPSLLTAFSNLERCELQNTTGSSVDLEPLGCLAKLHTVVLRGRFEKLHHLTGLTRLKCASNFPRSDGVVSGVHKLASTLQHLDLDSCVLQGIHSLGLSACTALTQLVLNNPCVLFDNGDVYLDKDLSLSPDNLGQLAQLHTLHLETSEEEFPSLSWISVLKTHQHLTIYIRGCNDSPVEPASWLTNLTHLDIYAESQLDNEEDPVLNIDVAWDKLQALQILSICFFRLQLGLGVGGLLQLPQLREISVYGSTVIDPDNECFAALMFHLARARPEVKVACFSGDLTYFFERLP